MNSSFRYPFTNLSLVISCHIRMLIGTMLIHVIYIGCKMRNCIFEIFVDRFKLLLDSMMLLYIHQKVFLLYIFIVSHGIVVHFEFGPLVQNNYQGKVALPL